VIQPIQNRSRRRSGFSLVELLITFGLLVTLAFCIQNVLLGAQKISRAASAVSDRSLAWSSAINRLRADAWQAMQITQTQPNDLQFCSADNRTLRWQISPDGSLTRNSDLLSSQSPGQSFSITAAGAVMHCNSFDLQLTCPVLLMQKEQP